MNKLTVILWLCCHDSPVETPNVLGNAVMQSTIREVCRELELLNPAYLHLYFRWPAEFQSDLAHVRRIYRATRDLPRLADSVHRLPPASVCDAALGHLCREDARLLDAYRLNMDWRDRIDDLRREIDRQRNFWQAVNNARGGHRESFAHVLAVLSPDEWNRGLWPMPGLFYER